MRSPKVQRAYIGSSHDMCFACGRNQTSQTIDLNEVHVASQLTSLVSVSVCNTCRNMYPSLTRVRLVRVRVIRKVFSDESYEEILHPLTCGTLRSKVQMIGNLHFHLQWLYFGTYRCTEEIIERMPNLKELKVSYYGGNGSMEWSYYCLQNLARLRKLESLFVGGNGLLSLENLRFPTSLKELRLYGCSFPWEKLMILGSSLPNLKVLSLSKNTYKGQEWNQVEGEFPRLKVLTIFDCSLVWWRAENVHFPNLESLVLSFMWKLKEIPSVIGDIPTLRSIHLESCNNSLVDSAVQILEEQQSYGNESLQLYVDEKQVVVS
ncbi:UNVERIFIED_CONTAM: putative late blight resistance proteinR1B-16 [Sesamum radiatum]|uniref:Late blight resistance proteinR1B-16 n=1 Tax=Sesamum radiatum TaxID=300843 RepID=A0AAW2PIL4_SESRA